MKWYSRLAGCLAVFVAFSLSAASTPVVMLGKQPVAANRVLARFKAGVNLQQRADALAGQSATVYRQYSRVSNLVAVELLPQPRLSSVVPGPNKSLSPGKELMRRIQALRDTGVFDYVEPDYIVHINLTPSDTAYSDGTLWGLNNTGASGGVAGADIQAAEAWDITTGDANVIVGVIDTGIRYTHQELVSQMWNNPGEIPGNGIDDDNDGYVDDVHGINSIIGTGDPMDDNEHGTHVSGTIDAQANGGGPHVGVAWNVKLMGLKFLDANGSGNTSDAIECVNYAVAEKARLGPNVRMILSNSWGGGAFSQGLLDAITAARDAGILFVAAAGNDGNNNDSLPSYPASYEVDNVISVAAIDRSNQLAYFSNYGANTVHLGAPGVDIYSCVNTSDTAYATFSGTSMATPHVSGVAALIWSAFPNASLAEVRQRLLVGTVPIPALNGVTVTGGRLNAYNSLTVAPDGKLEISVSAQGGLRVVPGTTVAIRVSVTDLTAVNNATVTGSLSTGGNLTFVNDGTPPDATPNDNVYSANMTVPDGVSAFTLLVTASAPGKVSASANVGFTVIVPPPNDMFANAEVITSLPALRTGSNLDSTPESGEPNVENIGGGSTVWYAWTAGQSGVVTASTDGSNFDTLLGVYTGTAVTALSLVGSNDDVNGSTFTSAVVFQAVAGQTYHFLIDGYFGDQGDVQFNLDADPPLTNDNFNSRTAISGINKTFTGYNLGATSEANEPANNGLAADRSVWWEWDSGTISGTVYLSTVGSTFDTRVAVYTGSAFGSLTLVAQNNDVDFNDYLLQSEVSFAVAAGQKYQIAVNSARVDDGAIKLTIAQQPDNDFFASARTLTGTFAVDTGLNIGASGQTGEPDYDPALQNSKSLWWKWTAPKSGNAVVTTDGSPFDTTLAVYTGQTIGSLALVAVNDDRNGRLYTSLVSFGAVQGTTYYIKVDGYFYDPWVDDGVVDLLLSMDGASRLGTLETREDGSLSLELIGEPERPYLLSATPDFLNWTPVSTNTPISRRLLISQPAPVPGSQGFYRAQPASLVGGK